LLKLQEEYKLFLDQYQDSANPDQDSIAFNGNHVILSIIGFLIKNKRNLINLALSTNHDQWELEVQSDTLNGRIFSDYKNDDFETVLFSLFLDIITELTQVYQGVKQDEKTVSNFFKTDNKYYIKILPHFINRYIRNAVKKREVDSYLILFQ
jgi:hypothetical protein